MTSSFSPTILPADSAIPGTVSHLSSYSSALFLPGSAILCRNNAPLIAFAYSLISRDIPCRILGRDIGAGLIALVRQMHTDDLDDLQARLEVWRNTKVARCLASDRDPTPIEDQYAALSFLISTLDSSSLSVRDLIARIELLFDDNDAPQKITLSTIHKAKGGEWPTVFLLDWNLFPSKYDRKPWQIQQSRNLQYVAVTRSLDSVFFIQSGCWKEDKK